MSNIDIVKTGLKAWESNDAQTLTALVADDFVLSGPVPQPVGKQEFLGLMQIFSVAMPDFAFNISSFEEEGDRVTAKAHVTGTHTGVLALPGMPPISATGIKVSLPEEVQTFTLKDGKLQALSTNAGLDGGVSGVLSQLGVALPPV